jgi:hypothetical protein
MSPRRGWLRVVTLLWAVLQLALPSAITIADATLAPASARFEHVEESSGTDCASVHADDCALCRYLTNFSAEAPRAECLAHPEQIAGRPERPATSVRVAAIRALPLSRAPPLA